MLAAATTGSGLRFKANSKELIARCPALDGGIGHCYLGAFYLTFASNYECPEQVAGAMDHVEARAAAKQPTDTYDITVLTVMAESEDPTLVERAIASFRLIAQTPASGFTRVEALMELEKHDPDILEFVESCVDDPEEYVAEECQRIRSEKQ